MDIFAHALWSLIIVKIINQNKKGSKDANLFYASFFGIIPDLFAFTFLTVWSTLNFGVLHPEDHGANIIGTAGPVLNIISESLYNLTHSLIIVLIIFFVIYIITKKIYVVLIGWPVHILLDIPTHTKNFYPTPFLWPISEFKVSGINWTNNIFTTVNYFLIFIFLIYLFRKEIHKFILE